MLDLKISLATVILTFVLFTGGSQFIVSVSATSDPTQNVFTQKREGLLLYNNTQYGFQVLYPQGWTFVEGDTEPGDYLTNIVTFEPLGEKGKHFSKKFICGEVCLGVLIDNSAIGGQTLEQFSDGKYNDLKSRKEWSKLLDYNSFSKLGDRNAFEISWEGKQGKREYLESYKASPYPAENADESKAFFVLWSKTRDKYSDEMLPLMQTMIDSFKFTEIKK